MAKKNKRHEEHIDETWLIPYADLLTLLLALFIVLFASSSVDVKKFQQIAQSLNIALNGGVGLMENPAPIVTQPEQRVNPGAEDIDEEKKKKELKEKEKKFTQETEQLEKLKKQLDALIAKNSLTGKLQTRLTEEGLLVVILDNALFASGSAEVRPDARNLVAEIGKLLVPDSRRVTVSGHTDNVPINTAKFPSNWELSSQRALNFMKIVLENKELDPKKFSATGYGEYHPIASNDTVEGKAKNRRVEVAIQRNYQVSKK